MKYDFYHIICFANVKYYLNSVVKKYAFFYSV